MQKLHVCTINCSLLSNKLYPTLPFLYARSFSRMFLKAGLSIARRFHGQSLLGELVNWHCLTLVPSYRI